jgi:hypothetical protein
LTEDNIKIRQKALEMAFELVKYNCSRYNTSLDSDDVENYADLFYSYIKKDDTA